jgi:hypothetical protein
LTSSFLFQGQNKPKIYLVGFVAVVDVGVDFVEVVVDVGEDVVA